MAKVTTVTTSMMDTAGSVMERDTLMKKNEEVIN